MHTHPQRFPAYSKRRRYSRSADGCVAFLYKAHSVQNLPSPLLSTF